MRSKYILPPSKLKKIDVHYFSVINVIVFQKEYFTISSGDFKTDVQKPTEMSLSSALM